MSSAARLGSDLVVFPELAFTGYSFLNTDQAAAVAEPWDGPTMTSMRYFAVSADTHVAWGYVESDPATGLLHNSATLLSPDGVVIARHRKMNLWGNDFLWATPGSAPPPVVETELGMMSVIVCRDLRDRMPKLPRTASLYGDKPDVVAACTNWGEGGFPSTTWMDFVAENSCTMVVANRWGEETSGSFSQDFGHGGSAIIGRDWKVHTGGLKFGADCVVSAAFEETR